MLVSIVMSVLNGEKFLSLALDSVLKQTHRQFEFIIINNGSKDNTGLILNDFAERDQRIKIIYQDTTSWADAINKAILISKGDWIARMDPDDIMDPSRLEKQVAFIKANLELDVASSFVYLIDKSNKIIGRTKSNLINEHAVKKQLELKKVIGIAHPAVIMRKEKYFSIGGYRGRFWPCDDLDLWTRIAQSGGKILVQPEYLLYYRIHDGSISRQSLLTNLRKSDWVKACAICRSKGESEPLYEDFVNSINKQSLLPRINSYRKLFGKYFYKCLVREYIESNIFMIFVYGLFSLLTRPLYVIRQSSSKLRLFSKT